MCRMSGGSCHKFCLRGRLAGGVSQARRPQEARTRGFATPAFAGCAFVDWNWLGLRYRTARNTCRQERPPACEAGPRRGAFGTGNGTAGTDSRQPPLEPRLSFKLDQEELEAFSLKVLREVLTSGSHEHLPSLAALFLGFPIWRSESDMEISQENRHGVWVPVHH
jgi:hypothetical protein